MGRMKHLLHHKWDTRFICPEKSANSNDRGGFAVEFSDGDTSVLLGASANLSSWDQELSSEQIRVPGLLLRGVEYYEGKACSSTHRFATAALQACPLSCASPVHYFHMPYGVWVPYIKASIIHR